MQRRLFNCHQGQRVFFCENHVVPKGELSTLTPLDFTGSIQMHTRSVRSVLVVLAFAALALTNVQVMNVVYGRYVVDSIEVSIQKPEDAHVEANTNITLIVRASFRYGTTSTLDEFSFENITCRYSLDKGEWKNITSKNVTSNTATPDINFWNGYMHTLNATYKTVLEGLPEGAHFINVTLTAKNKRGDVNDSDTLRLSVTDMPSNSSNQTVTPALSNPQLAQTVSSKPQTQPPQPEAPEFKYAILSFAIAMVAITVGALSAKTKSHERRIKQQACTAQFLPNSAKSCLSTPFPAAKKDWFSF